MIGAWLSGLFLFRLLEKNKKLTYVLTIIREKEVF